MSRFTLTLESRREPSAMVLRRLLKMLLRRYGLRCLSIESSAGAPDSAPLEDGTSDFSGESGGGSIPRESKRAGARRSATPHRRPQERRSDVRMTQKPSEAVNVSQGGGDCETTGASEAPQLPDDPAWSE